MVSVEVSLSHCDNMDAMLLDELLFEAESWSVWDHLGDAFTSLDLVGLQR